ncbi:exodeoxyribonuclease V subunit gamma [Hoyosella altamirensis]|uniref:RecBCD enzyme subunit RecC n=1 Tax=Hoyosella altamirensis TaxID=616997 RepID=A0A839RJ34_9ACTN|nr:exodeoxyribonuclease V subunit gamma [Hoyosella altamirensis]MBB3036460.1 exodeoxyribonuclease V gamma subunit [Hoyosella altamirensis]
MLKLHRAGSAARLATQLARHLEQPLADPFAAEVISVPAKGVERWLSQRLSTVLGAGGDPLRTDGIAANIEFPAPSRVVEEAIAAASGVTADDDPWAIERVVWHLLQVLDASVGQPWCAVLARHFGRRTDGRQDFRAGRRYATAAHLTGLFRRYSTERPDMLVDWAAGLHTDGAGSAIDADLDWQPQLWQELRGRIGHPSPAERLADVCARIRDMPECVPLPERLSFFGPTRLTTEQLRIIKALSAGRAVHVWTPHPSPALWDHLRGAPQSARRSGDTSVLGIRNPLLASLSRDVREFQLRIEPLCDEVAHYEDSPAPGTTLRHLQASIQNDEPPAPLAQTDPSIEIHSCHGVARQVEVLRECLLHLFSDIPDLEPRDVLIMCPDVETFAPHIRAVFGQDIATHPGQQLRVRLADRNLRQTNPLLSVVASLLELAASRVTASELLDFAANGPVRRAFGFKDEDIERLREWTVASGARWGLGDQQRSRFRLGGFPQNTFATGLDRILLGVAADESDLAWIDRALPLDDIGSGDIDLAGKFAELADRLDTVLRSLQGLKPARQWTHDLVDALDLLTEVPAAEAWQVGEARSALGDATRYSDSAELRLPDVRVLLERLLAGRPTRANFRTGELTVCTMVPMRSVPHRVVILLGLDDDKFPRGAGIDGDDVLSRDPCVGERDPRSEDRQLLLDAIMAAQERLLLFFTGCDPVTGNRLPPAVPLGEVVDAVTALAGSNPVTTHPLQPFDVRNFDPARPHSYDMNALAGARASQQPPKPARPFLDRPMLLAAKDTAITDLSDLVNFVVHPVQAFLRQRLGVVLPSEEDEIDDAFSAEVDNLVKWNIGDRMLNAVLSGHTIDDFRNAELRRGTLPPFTLGTQILDDISTTVDILSAASHSFHSGQPQTYDIDIDLGQGRRVTGSVSGVHGETLARTIYSRLGPKHRLHAWVHLVALACMEQGNWRAVTTGRGQGQRPAWRSVICAPDDPIALLRRLVDLRERGLTAPLPIAQNASAEYANRRHSGRSIDEAFEAASKTFDGRFGDCTDEHYSFVYGPGAQLASLASARPEADEASWSDDPTRFGVLACRLWLPLLDNESQVAP